jgi:hypothetical protein
MQGDLSPIGVVYRLAFLAMRPAYAVTLEVDWDRVQERLDEEFGVDALFFATQIEDAVDRLVDDRVITLRADTFVPEDEEDEAAVLARRDRAVDEVRDMITQAFFEPSINPAAEPKDGWDQAVELANSVSRLAVTGGLSSFAGFSYKKTHYTRVDRKTLNVSMSERTTVRREIYPQEHLSGLFRELAAAGVDLDRFVHDVRLDDDPFFRRRRLTVVPRVDFDREGVTSLDVRLRYAGEAPRNVVFDRGTGPQTVDWPMAVAAGAAVPDVQVDYTVNLAGVPGADRPASIAAPAEPVTGDVVEILTRELYEIVPVTVTTLGVPWDRYPRVEAALRYEDPTRGISADDTVVLDAARPEATWHLFAARGGPRTYTYALTYRSADGREVVRPPQASDDTTVLVPAPFPASLRRVVEVLAVADWTRTATMYVDWSYADRSNGVRDEGSLTFTPADNAPRSFAVDLADPAARVVDYRVTTVDPSGDVTLAPPSQTLDRRIIARPGRHGHRVVTVVPADVDFAAAKVDEVAVELRHEDAGTSVQDTVTFRGPDDRGTFEFDYADEARAAVRHRTTTTWANGLTSRTDWTDWTDADGELVVPVGDAT